MYCSKCGTELPDGANFCWQCGLPQRGQDSSPSSESGYECCILEAEVGIVTGHVRAKVENAVIAERHFNPWTDRSTSARNQLAAELASRGWQPVTHDEYGCVVMMRRHKSSAP